MRSRSRPVAVRARGARIDAGGKRRRYEMTGILRISLSPRARRTPGVVVGLRHRRYAPALIAIRARLLKRARVAAAEIPRSRVSDPAHIETAKARTA